MTVPRMMRSISVGWDRTALEKIVHPEAALAIWWRRISESLTAALDIIDLEALEDISLEIDARGSIETALRAAGYPQDAVAALSADVDPLIAYFATLTGEDRLSIRLEVVETNVSNCSFQAHYCQLKLDCTYVGSGTQWCCVEGQDAICEVPTGMVGVFKGRMLLNPPAVLQRSPPIDGPRLVLSMNYVGYPARNRILSKLQPGR